MVRDTFLAGVKPGTAKRYRVIARMLDPHFGALYLDQITRRSIAAYVTARKKEGATNATIRRDLTALSRILASAVGAGLIDANPAREWDRSVIRERRDPILPPSLEEIELVARRAPPAFARVIRLAAQTGVRQMEAVTLEWRDVDLQAGTATLMRTKTSRPRTIALRSPGGDATGSFLGTPRHLHSSWVFWHSNGARYAEPAGMFRELVKRVAKAEAQAGRAFRPFRFHDLRHAFTMRWLRAGGDLYALSRHLGHTSLKTTEMYLGFLRAEEPGQEPDQPRRFSDG